MDKLQLLAMVQAYTGIGVGLILPGIAYWRAHDALPSSAMAPFVIGLVIFAFGAFWGGVWLAALLRKRHKAE